MLTIDFGKFPIRPGDRILDAGCGEGRHLLACSRSSCHIVGLDLNSKSLRKARSILEQMKRGQEVKGRVFFIQGDSLHFPFPDGVFDKVICSEVIEHVADERQGVKELCRILTIGGKIALSVPTLWTEHLYDLLSKEYFRTPGGHVRKVRPRSLSKIMEAEGLRPYAVGFAHAFHSPYWALRCIVGLQDESSRAASLYRRFLTRAMFSPSLRRLESFGNYFFPKSFVIYGQKRPPIP